MRAITFDYQLICTLKRGTMQRYNQLFAESARSRNQALARYFLADLQQPACRKTEIFEIRGRYVLFTTTIVLLESQ